MEDDTSIGATIDGPPEQQKQQQGAIKNFFSDPKNLATMLVLGSALAQPRRGGAKPLAHALKSGVGALAFRGGLDQGIHAQQQKDQQQMDEAAAAAARIDVANRQVDAQQYGTAVSAQQAQLDRDSRERLSQADIDAGKFARDTTTDTGLQKVMAQAQKAYYDAYAQWVGFGRQGEAPSFGEFVLPAMQVAGLSGIGGLNYDFQPTQAPAPEGDPNETVVDPARPKVKTAPQERGYAVPGALSKSLRSNVPQARAAAIAERRAKRDFPKETEGWTGEQVLTSAQQVQELTQPDIDAGLSQEEAKALIADKFKFYLLSEEQQKAVRLAARGPVKTPSTPRF